MLSKFHGNSGVRRFLTVLRGNRFTGLEYGHPGLGTAVVEGKRIFFTFLLRIQAFLSKI